MKKKSIKKTTLIDRIRKAWRAFCNKPASSIALGVELKRCCECERREQSETAREIFAEIDRMCIDTFGNFNHRVFAELKKNYTEN